VGIISPSVHRILDFVVVLLFAVAPTVFHMTGNTMYLAYGLAAIHLVLTLLTHFPGRAGGSVPFHLHGIVELVVGVVLLAVPFVRHWTYGARTFYPSIGALIIVVWALTRYRDAADAGRVDARPAV
jgi:hypothetical protein